MKQAARVSRIAWGVTAVALACGALLPAGAMAYSFKPTPAEWAMWPDFCKARYVQTSVGRQSPYKGTVPPAITETAKKRIGNQALTHVHHYCASLVYIQRAGVARSGQERKHLLRQAEGDCNYSLKRTPTTSPIYREIANHCQMAAAMRAAAI
jgi:hypothetical protein